MKIYCNISVVFILSFCLLGCSPKTGAEKESNRSKKGQDYNFYKTKIQAKVIRIEKNTVSRGLEDLKLQGAILLYDNTFPVLYNENDSEGGVQSVTIGLFREYVRHLHISIGDSIIKDSSSFRWEIIKEHKVFEFDSSPWLDDYSKIYEYSTGSLSPKTR